MSESNRGKRLAIGLIAAGFCATVFILIATHLASDRQWEAENEAANAAADYARNADYNIATKCAALPPSAKQECAQEENDAARKNQRDEYDLAAQKTMGIWTTVMGWMAIFGGSLSGIGVYLIWQTWRESQRGASAARVNADAYIWNERAWLEPIPGAMDVIASHQPKGQRIQLSSAPLSFRNKGNSTAVLRALKYYISESPDKKYTVREQNLRGALVPVGGESEGVDVYFDEWEDCRKFWIVGALQYGAIGNAVGETFFCFRVEIDDDGFSLTVAHEVHAQIPANT